MVSFRDQYQLHTAEQRPDLWKFLDDPSHPLNAAWPLFLDQDETYRIYANELAKLRGLSRFQFVLVDANFEGHASIVAYGRSIPFFWPELHELGGRDYLEAYPEIWDTLPDGGYDTILARGVKQYLTREGLPSISKPLTNDQTRDLSTSQKSEPPNALSAISITVHPNYRERGLARIMIEVMKQAAIKDGLDVLVVPLRPTLKKLYPCVDIIEYIAWERPQSSPSSSSSSSPSSFSGTDYPPLPFDPWLRSHVRLGAQIIKVAPCSMHIEGSAREWRRWTGIDPASEEQEVPMRDVRIEPHSGRRFKEIEFPGGLVPLRFYVKEDRCVYVEPNIWLYHDLHPL